LFTLVKLSALVDRAAGGIGEAPVTIAHDTHPTGPAGAQHGTRINKKDRRPTDTGQELSTHPFGPPPRPPLALRPLRETLRCAGDGVALR
jgi:hypothetical protein